MAGRYRDGFVLATFLPPVGKRDFRKLGNHLDASAAFTISVKSGQFPKDRRSPIGLPLPLISAIKQPIRSNARLTLHAREIIGNYP